MRPSCHSTAKLRKVDSLDGGPLTAEEVCQVLRAAPVPAGSIVGSEPRSVPGEPGLYAWWAVPGALPGKKIPLPRAQLDWLLHWQVSHLTAT
ncbi:hypothetical protein [Frankia sp. CiP1_Cm_nod1]|uniref:hypothetical protein n=1 Tax=Frankia sp. CiP1_Cm_nod1 TaxID=2897160 RepID=UPI002024DB50